MKLIRTLARHWKIAVPATGAVLAGVAWLAFGYFGVHTAFIDSTVDEDVPVFDAAPAMVVDDADATESADDGTVSPNESATDATESADDGTAATPAEAAGQAAPADAAAPGDPATAPPVAEEPAAAVSEPAEAAAPADEIVTEFQGRFMGLGRYDVSGDALVLGNGTGQRFLRFENFDSNNGPDLNVYLVNPDDPNDFVDLGDLSGNIGNQNYEIPADVDLDRYRQVAIWCVRFSVGFGTADLTPAA